VPILQWTGKPYRSKQCELACLTIEDGIGIEKLTFEDKFWHADKLCSPVVDGIPLCNEELAHDDGLSTADWMEWFMDYNLDRPMAIIQFTEFRYN